MFAFFIEKSVSLRGTRRFPKPYKTWLRGK